MANPLPPQSRADVAQSSLFNPHLNPIPPKPYYTRPNTVQTLRGNIRTIASLQKSKRDADDQLMSLKRTYLTNFKQATNGRASSFLALKRKISQLSHQVLQTRELLNSFPFIIRNYVETQRGTPMTKATNSIFRRFPQGKLALLQDTFALHREFIFMSTHLKQRTLCLHHIKQTLQQQLDHYLNTAIQSLQTVFTVEPLPPQLILSTSPSITKKKGAQTHEQALFQSMVGVPDFKFDAASLFQSRRITSTPTTSPLASAFLVCDLFVIPQSHLGDVDASINTLKRMFELLLSNKDLLQAISSHSTLPNQVQPPSGLLNSSFLSHLVPQTTLSPAQSNVSLVDATGHPVSFSSPPINFQKDFTSSPQSLPPTTIFSGLSTSHPPLLSSRSHVLSPLSVSHNTQSMPYLYDSAQSHQDRTGTYSLSISQSPKADMFSPLITSNRAKMSPHERSSKSLYHTAQTTDFRRRHSHVNSYSSITMQSLANMMPPSPSLASSPAMSVTLSHSYSQSTMHSNHHHGSPSTPSKSTSHLLNHTSLFLDRIEEYFSCGIGVLVFIVSLLSKYLGYPHQFRILPRFSRSVVVVPPSVSLPTLDAPYFTHRRHVQQFMFEFEKSLATEFKHPHLSRFTTQPAYGLQYYPSFTTLSNYTASAQLSRARTDQAQVSQRRNKPQTRTAPAPTVPQVQEPPTPSPSAFPLYVHQKRATLFQHGLYLLSQSVLALQKRFGMRHISATSAETQSSYVDISIPTNILSLYSFISSLSPRHLEPTRPNSEGWNVCFEFDGDSDDTNNLILPPTLNSSDTIHQIHFLAPSFLPTNHL